MAELRFEYRKCRACGGSGRKADGERLIDGVFSMGASLIADALTGESVFTRRCRACDGRGETRRVASLRDD